MSGAATKSTGLALTALLALACGVAATAMAAKRAPAPGAETTRWLATRSLAVDHDLVYGDVDRERFRSTFGAAPEGVRTKPLADAPAGDRTVEFDVAPLAARAWGFAARIAPGTGPFALGAIVFAATLAVAAFALGPALGETVGFWLALLAFGSSAFASVFRLEPELFAFAAVVVGCAVVWSPRRRRASPESPAADVYAGELPGDPPGDLRAWRWLFAGLAFGFAAVRHPLYLAPALAAAVDLPARRRGATAALFAAGIALPLAFVAGANGLPWAAPAPVLSPALFGWNLVFAAAGRSAGVVLWFAPALAVAAFARRRRGSGDGGRALLPWFVFAALALELVLQPFDWAGDRAGWGNPFFLPLYGALWFALDTSAARLRAVAGSAALAFVVALPWLVALGPQLLRSASSRMPTAIEARLAPVRAFAPLESSLREIPGVVERRQGTTRLRTLDSAIAPAPGKPASRDARLYWSGSRVATLELASDEALGAIELELGDQAPSSIEVAGGEAGDTRFRPGGQVDFEVLLRGESRRHPLWWSGGRPASIYEIRLTLPEPPEAPISFTLGSVRPAGIAPAGGPGESPARGGNG